MSNTTTFHGRLVKDAKSMATREGKAMLRFTVASNTGFGEHKHTNFFDVVIMGKRAEGRLIDYLIKGAAVFVSGELKVEEPREYQGKHYNNISLFNPIVDLIGSKDRSQNENDSAQKGNDLNDDVDSIPF